MFDNILKKAKETVGIFAWTNLRLIFAERINLLKIINKIEPNGENYKN